jgi:EpsI family protein
MLNTTARVFIVVSVVVLLAFSARWLPTMLQPNEIKIPEWELTAMPMQFDRWRGTETEELDAEVTKRLEAKSWIDRKYSDDENRSVFLHVALFDRLDDGVRHSPINCYRGNGWRETKREDTLLYIPDQPGIPARLTTWTRDGNSVLVMYWFQLGDRVIFDRPDLFLARLHMWRKNVWPAMVKVLLQTDATDGDAAKERIQTIARKVYEWINLVNQPASSAGGADTAPAS